MVVVVVVDGWEWEDGGGVKGWRIDGWMDEWME